METPRPTMSPCLPSSHTWSEQPPYHLLLRIRSPFFLFYGTAGFHKGDPAEPMQMGVNFKA